MSNYPYPDPFATPAQPPANPIGDMGSGGAAPVTQPQTNPTAAPQPPQTGASGNPFTDVLNHVATWNQALAPTGAPTGPTLPTTPTGADNQNGGDGGTGGGGTGGTTGGGTGTGGTGTGTGGTTGDTGTGGKGRIVGKGSINPQTGKPYGQDNPGGVNQDIWDSVDRYVQSAAAQGADYSFLYAHPEYVENFRNWAGDPSDPTRSGVDITDWLAHTYPTEPAGLAGRNGARDTYIQWLDAHGGVYDGPPASSTGGGVTTTGSGGTRGVIPTEGGYTPGGTTTTGGTGTGTGVPHEGGTGGTGGTTGDTTGGGGVTTTGGTTTGGVIPNETPYDPNAPMSTDETQRLIDIFNANFGGDKSPDIEAMLDPMFGRQRQKLQQQLEAAAALTPGRLQSGGFGQNEGQAISDLSGQQSAQLATALQQQQLAKMQQNTQIMQLATQAGMQKYVADVNADVQKFGIQTNADLQKWLDNNDNVLKKYGIDTNTVLEQYKADLALKGEEYSADKAYSAAGLNAAVAKSAAAAASAASQANAKLQYDLGMAGIGVQRENNIGNFVLGLLGLGNVDMNQLNQILAGLPGGTTVVKP